jgi:hypothetical protein
MAVPRMRQTKQHEVNSKPNKYDGPAAFDDSEANHHETEKCE